jgi:hypothetical protein
MMKRVLFAAALFIIAIAAASCGGSEKLEEASVTMGMPLLSDPEKHKVGWGRSDCASCHPYLPAVHPRQVALPGYTQDMVCISCHLGNGSGYAKKTPDCVFCHTNGAKPVNVSNKSAHSLTRYDDGYSNPAVKVMADIDCVICHDNTNMDGVFTKADLSGFGKWDRAELNGFCLACHSPEGVTAQGRDIKPADIKTKYEIDYHGAGSYADRGFGDNLTGGYGTNYPALPCLSCHTNHSSANRKLFRESFADGEGEFAVRLNNPSDLRDLCAQCHQNIGGVPAPNGKKQTVKHDKPNGWCFKSGCHPVNGHILGAEYAEHLMTAANGGAGCASCHRHGANMGQDDTTFPYGIKNHSIF